MALISGSGPPPSHPSRDDSLSTTDDARRAFRSSLSRVPAVVLESMAELRGLETDPEDDGPTIAAQLVDQLDDPTAAAKVRDSLSDGERLAVGLFGLTENSRWPAPGLLHALSVLGVPAEQVVDELVERALLAVAVDGPGVVRSLALDGSGGELGPPDLLIHPALASGARIRPPTEPALPVCEAVAQVRESDGLEPILRLAALWQRLGAEPARLTQSGALYKRDRERIEGDALISGPFVDAQTDAGDAGDLIMRLAKRIGLIRLDSVRETLTAAPVDFWSDNAFHLPWMIASAWLGMRSWREWTEEEKPTDPTIGEPLVYLRPALLLWLAGLEPEAWVTLDDLAAHLNSVYPDWDRLSLLYDSEEERARSPKASAKRRPSREDQARMILDRVLLGGAAALGLVRTADEQNTGRKAVQLTALGRYAMRVGPPPTAAPPFEKFLFAQPNLDLIAYRQGLTPSLIGRLSQFAWWTKIDAAIELRLTRESIGEGLDWGMTVPRMLEILTRHSQRPLPGSLTDAVERWAKHRERVVFYESATLIEFDSPRDRDQAVSQWTLGGNGDGKPFLPVGDRFVLIEDARDVPTGRISTTASRDYRLPPERCVSVESDGVTLVLDPTRSDLLIDAELSRFADEAPAEAPSRLDPLRPAERRFIVSSTSLRRGLEHGLTPALLADWFARRVGTEPPPAIKLMARPALPKPKPWRAARRLVLEVPTADLLDGIEQHPRTRLWLGDRLGPVSVEVPEENIDRLREALAELGVTLDVS